MAGAGAGRWWIGSQGCAVPKRARTRSAQLRRLPRQAGVAAQGLPPRTLAGTARKRGPPRPAPRPQTPLAAPQPRARDSAPHSSPQRAARVCGRQVHRRRRRHRGQGGQRRAQDAADRRGRALRGDGPALAQRPAPRSEGTAPRSGGKASCAPKGALQEGPRGVGCIKRRARPPAAAAAFGAAGRRAAGAFSKARRSDCGGLGTADGARADQQLLDCAKQLAPAGNHTHARAHGDCAAHPCLLLRPVSAPPPLPARVRASSRESQRFYLAFLPARDAIPGRASRRWRDGVGRARARGQGEEPKWAARGARGGSCALEQSRGGVIASLPAAPRARAAGRRSNALRCGGGARRRGAPRGRAPRGLWGRTEEEARARTHHTRGGEIKH